MLVRRRRVLAAHAATQRAQLAETVGRLRGPLALADGAFRVGRALRHHPTLLVAALALLATPRKSALVLWSGRFFTAMELLRVLRGPGRVAK